MRAYASACPVHPKNQNQLQQPHCIQAFLMMLHPTRCGCFDFHVNFIDGYIPLHRQHCRMKPKRDTLTLSSSSLQN